jgi:hypothetical protein
MQLALAKTIIPFWLKPMNATSKNPLAKAKGN